MSWGRWVLAGWWVCLPAAALAEMPAASASPTAQASAVDDDVMVRTYRRAVELDPNGVVAHFNLGLALYKTERYSEAKAALERCLALDRRDVEAHQQVDGPAHQILGIISYNVLRDDRQAIEQFRSSLQLLPNDAATYYALGLACLRSGDPGQALNAFDRVLALGRGTDPDVIYQRGLALEALQRYDRAGDAYRQALELKPDLVPALESLALLYHRQDKGDETIEVLQRLLKLDPNNFNANYLLGLRYFQKKMYPEMVAAYSRAVAIKPDLAEAHYNLGMAYYYQTRYAQAIAELKQAVALAPQDAEAYTLLGQAQAAAIESYLHAGGTFLAQEKYREASAELQKVFAIDPNHVRARALDEDARRLLREAFAEHMRLADTFLAGNRLVDAYNEYERAAALDPGSSEAQEGRRRTGIQLDKLLSQRLQRARESVRARDYDEAFEQYASALALKPDYAPVQQAADALRRQLRAELKLVLAQAEAQAAKDQVNEAAAGYRKGLRILEVLPDDGLHLQAMDGLARVNARKDELIRQLLAQGRKAMAEGADAQAKAAFGKVLQYDPQNVRANESILKLTGTQAQAKVTDEEIKATYYRGVDAYVNGKIEDAIHEWEKVLSLDPENHDARINITRARAKLAAIRKLTEGN